MEYYKISQDRRLKDNILIANRDLKKLDTAFQNHEEAIVIYYEAKNTSDSLDYIDIGKHVLISDNLKKIFSKYEKEINFKTVFMIETKKGERTLFWLMKAPLIECLSEKSQYYPDGIVKTMIIDEQLAKNHTIFSVSIAPSSFFKKQIMINLDVAESILRRHIVGITYEKVLTC